MLLKISFRLPDFRGPQCNQCFPEYPRNQNRDPRTCLHELLLHHLQHTRRPEATCIFSTGSRKWEPPGRDPAAVPLAAPPAHRAGLAAQENGREQLGLCRRLHTTPLAARLLRCRGTAPYSPLAPGAPLRRGSPQLAPARALQQRPAGLPQPHSPACRVARRGTPSTEPRRQAGPHPRLGCWAWSSHFTHRGAGGRRGASPAAGDASSAQRPAPSSGHGAAAASPPGALRWRRRAAPRPAPGARHGCLPTEAFSQPSRDGMSPLGGPGRSPLTARRGYKRHERKNRLGLAGPSRGVPAGCCGCHTGVGVWGWGFGLFFSFYSYGVSTVCQ